MRAQKRSTRNRRSARHRRRSCSGRPRRWSPVEPTREPRGTPPLRSCRCRGRPALQPLWPAHTHASGAMACSIRSTARCARRRGTTPEHISIPTPMKEVPMSLKEQLAEYRAGWYRRVPAERQAIMQRHIEQLRDGAIARTMLKKGDRAPAIVLGNAKGETVEVGKLFKKGPVIVAFYRGGWCPYCNLELKAFQEVL